ncbi:MAG: NlpC/P60 family protein, partial [Paenibacillaceae bacterium]|nr:NlpC/P60 family protein [Paenibacillaceae bacterium]
MRNTLKFGMFLVCMALPLVLATSCSQPDRLRSNSVPSARNSPVRTEAVTDAGGTSWVPLPQVAQSLGLRLQETGDTANLGFTDVMFTVQPSQRHAISFGRPISLPQAPVRENGQLYMTMDAVSALLQTKARIDSRTGDLAFDRISPAGGPISPQTGTSQYGILGVDD